MAQKWFWDAKTGNAGRERSLAQEDGDLLREYQAMHEENILSRLNEEPEREEGKSVKKKGVGGRNTVEVKRRCLDRRSSKQR